jgi:hypothetical protein
VPDRGKLDRAIEDAVEETRKAKPDKAEVGGVRDPAASATGVRDELLLIGKP